MLLGLSNGHALLEGRIAVILCTCELEKRGDQEPTFPAG